MDAKRLVAPLALVALLGLSACAVHQDIEPVKPATLAPERFTIAGDGELPDRWWTVFGDDELDALVQRSLSGNLTLRQAWARLEQARAVIRIAGAGRLPSAEYAASAARTRSGEPGFNPSTFRPDNTIDQYTATASVTYQLDLWKQIDSGLQASILDLQAGRRDVEATAMTIASAVSDLWFTVAEQHTALELLRGQVAVNEEFLSLVELRFSQGLASAVDVFQQRLQVASIRTQIPQAETQLAILRHQLAVLLGRDPTQSLTSEPAALPALPPMPDTGIPAEMLRKRPDVRSAELRIYAADKRVAVAVADQFPKISFSASGGSRPNDVGDFFDRWFVNFAANLFGPIFDGGRRAAEADLTRAVVQERLLGWQQTVLTALREVEDALAGEAGRTQVLAGVQEQIRLARQTLEQARSRYVNGLSDYLNVLTALQALQNLERVELQIRRELVSNRIQLYVALGGTWTEELTSPYGNVTDED